MYFAMSVFLSMSKRIESVRLQVSEWHRNTCNWFTQMFDKHQFQVYKTLAKAKLLN